MKIQNILAAGLLLALAPACGRQLVEFANPDPNDGGDPIDANLAGGGGDAAKTDGPINPATPDARNNDTTSPDAGFSDARNPDSGIPDSGTADLAIRVDGDLSAPLVILTSPLDNAMNVPIRKRVTATFSKPMDARTISDLTFVVRQGLNMIAGNVSYDPATMTATFIPANDLALDTTYTATITTGAKDAAGNPLAMNHIWSWKTSACGQAPITLGSAGNFVVLAGSTVTNTGLTSVTGDLGVSPGTAVTGFPPGIVVGSQHAGTPTSAQGVADLTIAYNEAAGRTLCPVTVAGNLGGQTLPPGLYKSTSSLEITSGDLTLDAQGDGDAVFIFQMASTLTTTVGRRVELIKGAKAANVFWQVGTSATLGSMSAFQGTILADQAITLETGATLNGRALARITAVSLDSNVIVKPAP